jgi:hypothetical protein
MIKNIKNQIETLVQIIRNKENRFSHNAKKDI